MNWKLDLAKSQQNVPQVTPIYNRDKKRNIHEQYCLVYRGANHKRKDRIKVEAFSPFISYVVTHFLFPFMYEPLTFIFSGVSSLYLWLLKRNE